jgi:hypothetical protein
MATKKDPKDEAFGKAPEPESHPASDVAQVVPVVPDLRPAGRSLTWGERACGVGFNPSGDVKVDLIKGQFAAVLDTLHNLRESAVDGEVQGMYSVAITGAQGAQMWAVKAVTWRG